MKPLLAVDNLTKHYPVTGGLLNKVIAVVKAVDGISFEVPEGTTFGIAGESGCGKSTAARTILRLEEPTSGTITYDGQDITSLSWEQMRPHRTRMQMIFQDPYSSLNPRLPVGRIIAEPLNVHGIGTRDERAARVRDLLDLVGLPAAALDRYPFEFSGGQRQRIGIARALALNPRLIVADEPVSALDVSIRSQILNLMRDLQQRLGLTYVFIAHDLALIKNMSQQVGIMYLGVMVEQGPCESIFSNPLHPYTNLLLAAVPGLKSRKGKCRSLVYGDVPSPMNPPKGCRFHPRCPKAQDLCKADEPQPVDAGSGHVVRCHFPVDGSAQCT